MQLFMFPPVVQAAGIMGKVRQFTTPLAKWIIIVTEIIA